MLYNREETEANFSRTPSESPEALFSLIKHFKKCLHLHQKDQGFGRISIPGPQAVIFKHFINNTKNISPTPRDSEFFKYISLTDCNTD